MEMKSAFQGTNHPLRDSSIRNALKRGPYPGTCTHQGGGRGFQDHAAGESRELGKSPSHGPGVGWPSPLTTLIVQVQEGLHKRCSSHLSSRSFFPGPLVPCQDPHAHPTPGSIRSSISRGWAGPFPGAAGKDRKVLLTQNETTSVFSSI